LDEAKIAALMEEENRGMFDSDSENEAAQDDTLMAYYSGNESEREVDSNDE
jgi:hypothetical protein